MSAPMLNPLTPEEVGRLRSGDGLMLHGKIHCVYVGVSPTHDGCIVVLIDGDGYACAPIGDFHPTEETAKRLRPTSIVLTRTVDLNNHAEWVDAGSDIVGELRVVRIEIGGKAWDKVRNATVELTVKLTPKPVEEAPSA